MRQAGGMALWQCAVVLGVAAALAAAASYPGVSGTDADDRIVGSSGPDGLDGRAGSDLLLGLGGDDRLLGGPGYDRLFGGAGDDGLVDGSLGADLLSGGPGDDELRSYPRGLDQVRCGPGEDRVLADHSDIVAADCETVERRRLSAREARPAPREITVGSLTGAPIGTTRSYFLQPGLRPSGPVRLMGVIDGSTYVATGPASGTRCFVVITPGVASAVCGGRDGALYPRRIGEGRYRWFVLAPAWARRIEVGGRSVPVYDGLARFDASRLPGAVVAAAGGRSRALEVP